MDSRAIAPVVVGVDFSMDLGASADAQAAIDAAAEQALRLHAPLRLVHATPYPVVYATAAIATWDMDLVLQEAQQELRQVATSLVTKYPDLVVTQVVVAGGPSAVLLDQAKHASMVVLGTRGHGGFTGLLAGSVSTQVATHATVPVLVVASHLTNHPNGPVVVGVDGSPAAEAALGFAFEQAAARSAALVAVYAWDVPPTHNLGPVTRTHYDAKEADEQADRVLAEALAGWAQKYPDVLVRRMAMHSLSPVACLRDASAGAYLLVVGSRGRGGFTGLLLGSVSRAMVGYARCPVAVIHAPHHDKHHDKHHDRQHDQQHS